MQIWTCQSEIVSKDILDIIIFGDIMKMSKSNDMTSIFAVLQEAAVA